MPEQSKFENVDVTASLEAIMKQNAARRGDSLGNARHSGRALRYAPFRNLGATLAQC